MTGLPARPRQLWRRRVLLVMDLISPAGCSWTLVNPSSAGDPVSLLRAEPNIELKDVATAGDDSGKVAVALERGIAGPTATVRLEAAERVVGYVDAPASLDTVGSGPGAAGTDGLGAQGGSWGGSGRDGGLCVRDSRSGRPRFWHHSRAEGYFADVVRHWHVSSYRLRRRDRVLCW